MILVVVRWLKIVFGRNLTVSKKWIYACVFDLQATNRTRNLSKCLHLDLCLAHTKRLYGEVYENTTKDMLDGVSGWRFGNTVILNYSKWVIFNVFAG